MSAKNSNDHVPEHLIGTREGLFHLLRGTSIAPEDDILVRAEMPRVVRYKDVLLRASSAHYARRMDRPLKDKIAELLQEDEFRFYR